MNPPPSPSSPRPRADGAPQVQADVLGQAKPLQPPAPQAPSAPANPSEGAGRESPDLQEPQPAQDENQPGFIGERNPSHP